MTGKDLIIYILQNNLENASAIEIINKVLLTEDQIAAKFGVGIETIRAWQSLKVIDGICLRGKMYYYNDTLDPRDRR